MTKVLTRKPLAEAIIEARRTALMGAAATALIATAPAFASGPAGRSTHYALPTIPGSHAAIVIGNEDDITVGADQTAIGHAETEEDVELVNTGDLTGGIGIDVSTGAIDLGNAVLDVTTTDTYGINLMPLFDDAGNPVYTCTPYFCFQESAATGQLTATKRTTMLASDPRDSRIVIDNSGSIAFAGAHGIRAANPAGESITITNTGDIAATQDTTGRSGIYASTESFSNTYGELTQTASGQFTYNAYGQLTGVVTPDEFTADDHRVEMEYDGGAIVIDNSGDIDMGTVAAPLDPYAPRVLLSAGILTKGDGGTTIVNSGDINVDRWSAGIHAFSTGPTSITNSGGIDIGNGSAGISTAPFAEFQIDGDYRLGGDVYVLNTGDIRGGAARADLEPGETARVTGISILSLGSNNEYFAPLAHMNELYADYNEILGSDVYELHNIPNTRLYSTTAVNRGRIELLDGAAGIFVAPMAGDSTVVNEGTIIVGGGASRSTAYSYNPDQSAGIWQANSPSGVSSLTSVNAATGVIITGDDSLGIFNNSLGGDSTVINEGSITTGNGVVTRDAGYDIPTETIGIWSNSASTFQPGTTAYARNSGTITVGDVAIGMVVSGQGARWLEEKAQELTAINVNEGIVSTGDNAAGMFTIGTNVSTRNIGSVTTGDYDISAYRPHPTVRPWEFPQFHYGIASSGNVLSEVVNDGSITTGDGKVGASARMNYHGYGFGAQLIQGETGTITTGDGSVGAQVAGTYLASLVNEGEIAVGHDSVGIDMSAGSVTIRRYAPTATVIEGAVFAANDGIVETGDNSVGVRLNAAHLDVPYIRTEITYDPPGCYYGPGCTVTVEYVPETADSIGSAYLVNAGTISVGANSTAVEIAGAAANEQGLHLFNTGTIEVRGAGTAIRLNAGNDLGSYVVNVGTIAGDIELGAGDDRLVNTLFVDDFGQLISTGNIVMNGSTIDFGAGTNVFDNDRGLITFSGGDNLITGADLVMTQASIESRNGFAGSLLTIDGDLSGSFTFGTDVSAQGADRIVITGDVAEGSAMGIVLNPTQQFRGATDFSVITVEGANGAEAPVISGVTGAFADSLLGATARFDEETGEVLVTATFGMGHMATAAVSTTALAQNWWSQAAGSYDKRNMHRLAGAADNGLSVWGTVFHEEGTIEPGNLLQDTSFDQKLSGLQSGIQWTMNVGDGSFSVSPVFTYGDARASLNANVGSATGDAWAYGLNAAYTLGNGLYFDATWQTMTMDVDFRTPGTLAAATGNTDADSDGFTFETGYPVRLQSGLTLAPQVQYTYVDTELDDFTSSDGTYALTAMSGQSSLLRAGVSVFKTFETKNGSVTPIANVDYLDEMDGEGWLVSNGVVFQNDTSGSGYRLELGLAGRYKGWDITGRVGLTDTSVFQQSLSTNVNVRYRW